jgi:hypothetical protein
MSSHVSVGYQLAYNPLPVSKLELKLGNVLKAAIFASSGLSSRGPEGPFDAVDLRFFAILLCGCLGFEIVWDGEKMFEVKIN